MLPAPASPAIAGLDSMVVAALLLLIGWLIADAVGDALHLDSIVRLALTFPALVAFAFVTTLLHIATSGGLLSDGWLVRALALVTLALLWVRRMRQARLEGKDPEGRDQTSRADRTAFLGAVVLALAVWGSPIFRMLPLTNGGDLARHVGWAAQLLDGESTPSGPITGAIPNYYPWLYHGLLALTSRFVSGGRPYTALGALQLMQVFGSASAFFALGRQATRRWAGGLAASLLGATAGGFGFLLAGGPAIVMNARTRSGLQYMGDLLFLRHYDLAFGNLAPPLPRDITYALVPAFLLLLVLGMARRRTPILLAAGVVLGLVGLAGGEAWFVGVGVAFIVTILSRRGTRISRMAAVLVPAIALWIIWAGPLWWNYFRLDGFNNTARGAVELPPQDILFTWGIVVPLGVWGAFRYRRPRATPRVLWIAGVMMVVTAILIAGASIVARILGSGFTTLGRAHRYWPFLNAGATLFAAVGLVDLVRVAGVHSRRLAIAVWSAALVLAVGSPLAATIALPAAASPNATTTRSLEGKRTVLTLIDPQVGGSNVVAVPSSPGLLQDVVAYSGDRLLAFGGGVARHRYAHIRWRGIFQHIATPTQRVAANVALTTGKGVGRRAWLATARAYGVDIVAVPSRRSHVPAFRGCSPLGQSDGFVVIRVASCRSRAS